MCGVLAAGDGLEWEKENPMTIDPVVDADFAVHMAAYRRFLTVLMWIIIHIVVILGLMAFFLL